MRQRRRAAAALAGALAVFLTAECLGGTARSALSPALFAQLSTGIALIKDYNCAGRLIATGSGFLVGSGVVMTARHVIDPTDGHRPCRVTAVFPSTSVAVSRSSYWQTSVASGRIADLATLQLSRPVAGHIFTFRGQPVPLGTRLAMIGHPLGHSVALTQGPLLARARVQGIPIIAVDLLGAEGASGSPFVDDDGSVVGVLQIGLGGKDVLGQRTSGLVTGIDVVSWWGRGVGPALCRAYPQGGIVGCGATDATALLLKEADLPTFAYTHWHSRATGPVRFGGSCSQFVVRDGLRSSKERDFTSGSGYTSSVLADDVLVYETTAGARLAYQMTTSAANFDCFVASEKTNVLKQAGRDAIVTEWEAHRMSCPALGDRSSAGYIKYTYSTHPKRGAGSDYGGVLYWVDVLVRNTYEGFQFWVPSSTPIFPTYTQVLRTVTDRAR